MCYTKATDASGGIAMEIRYTQGKKEQPISVMKVEVMEGEKRLSKISAVTTRPTRYRSQWIPTMTVGGVATDPEYRRGGYGDG
jgi:predicted acetyltransferase